MLVNVIPNRASLSFRIASSRDAGIFWNASSDGAKMVMAALPAERSLLKNADSSMALASTENRPSYEFQKNDTNFN